MYKIIKRNGVYHRPLTTNAAKKIAQNGGVVYRYENGVLVRLFSNSVFAPNDGYYYTPFDEENKPRSDWDKPLVCPSCGHNEFYAHQVVRMDVVVGSDGEWLKNAYADGQPSIYDSETPYGPYTCTKCKHEFDV